MSEKETYQMDVDCDNCESGWIEYIEKGKPIKSFYICPKCGCFKGKIRKL